MGSDQRVRPLFSSGADYKTIVVLLDSLEAAAACRRHEVAGRVSQIHLLLDDETNQCYKQVARTKAQVSGDRKYD
jgi:hypothetical protein